MTVTINNLPPELKALIVASVAASDEESRRMQKRSLLIGEEWQSRMGKSRESLSMVSREWRSFMIPHLFESCILHMRQNTLPEAVRRAIRNLRLRSAPNPNFEVFLSDFIFSLPRLRRITLASSDLIEQFDKPEWLESRVDGPDDLVSRMQDMEEWDVEVEDVDYMIPVLAMTRTILKTLIVRLTGNIDGFSDNDDGFLAELADCSALRTLSLSHRVRLDYNELPDVYLSTPYLFHLTLTCLKISTPSGPVHKGFLRFAHLFPNLQSLTLVGNTVSGFSVPPSLYTFSNLSQLSLRFYSLDSATLFLSHLDLPAITSINLEVDQDRNPISSDAHLIQEILDSFRNNLERFRQTLRKLRLEWESRAYDGTLEGIATRIGPTLFDIHPLPPLDESASNPSSSTDLVYLPHQTDEQTAYSTTPYHDVQVMLDWMGERLGRMKEDNDRDGAVEMWMGLKSMREYKQWLEG